MEETTQGQKARVIGSHYSFGTHYPERSGPEVFQNSDLFSPLLLFLLFPPPLDKTIIGTSINRKYET